MAKVGNVKLGNQSEGDAQTTIMDEEVAGKLADLLHDAATSVEDLDEQYEGSILMRIGDGKIFVSTIKVKKIVDKDDEEDV